MKRRLIFTLAVAFLAMFSCTKHTLPVLPGGDGADTIRLKKLEVDEQHYRTFVYDSLGRFRRMEHWLSGVMNYVEAVYKGSEKTERIRTGDFQIKPVYTGDRVTAIGYVQHQVPDNDDPDIFEALQYDGNQITERRRYEIKRGTEVNIDKYSFTYHPDGDVKEIGLWYFDSDQNRFQLQSVLQLEYDGQKNPLRKMVQLFPWLYTPYDMFQVFLPTEHNVTQIKQYNNLGQLVVVKTFGYTYSAAGYPLTATEKWYGDTDPEPVYNRSMKYYY